MPKKKKKAVRRTSDFSVQASAIARRINGAKFLPTFASSLELAYRKHNLSKAVLRALRAKVASSSLPQNSKNARFNRIDSYKNLVRS